MSTYEPGIPDVADSLSQMAESTTAAELVRQKGQTKRVKVLSERKLVEWVETLLRQHMASREDAFSDLEKEELLRKTQAELTERIEREKQAETERLRIQNDLEAALARLDQAQRDGGDRAEVEQAMAALKGQLEETERTRDEVQQDNYELQDQLKEKLALLSATIAEKDKLRDTVRGQMMRSTALIEGVLGLDAAYYAARHADGNPVSDEAGDEERFFHDFDVGAAVIQTLSKDLERLRSITGEGGSDSDSRLLEADLALLQQLKAGNLNQLDVTEPVHGLVEALSGAREEADRLQAAAADATGTRPLSAITALPDADGDPRQVLAGCTTIARQLAAEVSQVRSRIEGLRQIADDADAARNQIEDDHRATQDGMLSVARALLDAAKGDAALSETAADLALALDDPQAAAELPQHIVAVVQALAARR